MLLTQRTKYYRCLIGFISGIFVLTSLFSCDSFSKKEPIPKETLAYIDSIKVVAHRGDWLNHPENSIKAIESCIQMGVDIVEIDIRKTKDNHLVLMHDETINRTTNGKGKVSEWTLEELKNLYLKDRFGKLSNEKIPTLEEALAISKNRIILKLDKSYREFQLTYDIVHDAEQLEEVIFKTHVSAKQSDIIINKNYKIKLIPMLEFPTEQPASFVEDHLKNPQVIGFEFILPDDEIDYIQQFEVLKNQGKEVWINSFWAQFNGGHDDHKFNENPRVYDWYLDNHATIIQTDYPERLIHYLNSKKAQHLSQ